MYKALDFDALQKKNKFDKSIRKDLRKAKEIGSKPLSSNSRQDSSLVEKEPQSIKPPA